MSTLQVPNVCGGITLVTSGALVPVANLVTCNALEITDIVQSYNNPSVVSSNITTGAVIVRMSTLITSITINGNVYAVTVGISDAMAAADASQLIYQGFKLVVG